MTTTTVDSDHDVYAAPPHDEMAEEALIGCLLLDGESLARIAAFLSPDDFYTTRARLCYEICLELFKRGDTINHVTVSHALSTIPFEEGLSMLDRIGGTEYLEGLAAKVPRPVEAGQFGAIVSRTSTYRKLIHAAKDIADIGYAQSPDVHAAISDAEAVLFGVRRRQTEDGFVSLRSYLDNYMEMTGEIDPLEAASLSAIVPTGFVELDQMLGGGLQASDLVLVAARPSVGKSTLALNIARAAAGDGRSVGIFSLEMSGEQVAVRLLSSEAEVDSHRLRLNLLSEREEQAVLDAIGFLSDLPIYIDQSPFQTALDIRSKARRLQMEHALDLLIIDYLQLVDTGPYTNRAIALGEVSRALKGVARELSVPVLACSQLSRAVEQRPSHRPILSDLRESGNLEQDSDVVAFIHREDRYTTMEQWEKAHPTERYPENIGEIILAKQRNGPTGSIGLYFREHLVRFETLDDPDAQFQNPHVASAVDNGASATASIFDGREGR